MSSPQSRPLAIMTVTAIAAASIGMYISGVKSKSAEQPKSVHGGGGLDQPKEPNMDSGEVRGAVHGK